MKKQREKNRTCRCDVCGDAFETHREDAKYCSAACRQLAYRERNGISRGVWSQAIKGRK